MRWEGQWEAYELSGRELGVKMKGAFLTTITARTWWSGTPNILDVRAQDWDDTNKKVREHGSELVLESATQGMRTLRYEDSLEIVHERIEFASDPNVLVVTPVEPGYNKHALRRTHRLLDT